MVMGMMTLSSAVNQAYLFTTGPEDADEDGHTELDDCDETDPSIYPGAEDLCGDGIDSDCDGVGALGSDDEDGDGLSEDEEDNLGTDPCNPDSDSDGVSDGEEVERGTDPLVDEDLDSGQPQDSGQDQDSGAEDSGGEDADAPSEPPPRCGCASSGGAGTIILWMLPLLALHRRAHLTS